MVQFGHQLNTMGRIWGRIKGNRSICFGLGSVKTSSFKSLFLKSALLSSFKSLQLDLLSQLFWGQFFFSLFGCLLSFGLFSESLRQLFSYFLFLSKSGQSLWYLGWNNFELDICVLIWRGVDHRLRFFIVDVNEHFILFNFLMFFNFLRFELFFNLLCISFFFFL